jgi:hypothetical protein
MLAYLSLVSFGGAGFARRSLISREALNMTRRNTGETGFPP